MKPALRLIPTHVGNTGGELAFLSVFTVNPREYGTNLSGKDLDNFSWSVGQGTGRTLQTRAAYTGNTG